MKLDFLNYSKPVKQELEKLPPMHRLALAAACCERLLPTYNTFCRRENLGNVLLVRKALDEVWQVLQGKPVDAARIRQLKEAIDSEDVLPDVEESHELSRAEYAPEAEDAIIAISITLRACLEPNAELVCHVGSYTYGTVELFICNTDESVVAMRHDADKEINALANHPLLLRELAKQSENLQRLQETQTLDRDFLEWLRTSFDNDGKSNIDAS